MEGAVIAFSVSGIFVLITAGWLLGKEKKEPSLGIIMLLATVVSFYLAIDARGKISNGLPKELTRDVNYQVQIVKEFSDGGQKWIGVLVLKEEGKTDPEVPPYGKILASFFKKEEIVYGLPITIEFKTLLQRAMIVKEGW